ncbi:unnamed protein product, partial [Boreogadus saida]
ACPGWLPKPLAPTRGSSSAPLLRPSPRALTPATLVGLGCPGWLWLRRLTARKPGSRRPTPTPCPPVDGLWVPPRARRLPRAKPPQVKKSYTLVYCKY